MNEWALPALLQDTFAKKQDSLELVVGLQSNDDTNDNHDEAVPEKTAAKVRNFAEGCRFANLKNFQL